MVDVLVWRKEERLQFYWVKVGGGGLQLTSLSPFPHPALPLSTADGALVKWLKDYVGSGNNY